ncbi:phage tail assembly chaperone [Aliihoeflea sp. PC F10.4]
MGRDSRCREHQRGDGRRGKRLEEALVWQLEWGDKADWLEKLAEDIGETPAALERRPELPAWLSFCWQAFWDLHTDRPSSFGGALPIPFSSVDRYAQRYGIGAVDHFDSFADVIRRMDRAYLKWAGKQKPGQASSSNSTTVPST